MLKVASCIEDALGLTRPFGAVLQSDGYSAYAHYAKKTGITHAQCWAHSRRKIYDARDIEPTHADQALDAIAALYKVEQQIRNDDLTGQVPLRYVVVVAGELLHGRHAPRMLNFDHTGTGILDSLDADSTDLRNGFIRIAAPAIFGVFPGGSVNRRAIPSRFLFKAALGR